MTATTTAPVTLTVQGPHRTHTFILREEVERHEWGAVKQAYLDHYAAGRLISSHKWGWCAEDTASDFFTRWRKNERDYTGYMLASYVLRQDLPCCGGRFELRHSPATEYYTVENGECSCCGARWSVTDGSHFAQRK